jgi:hypothetical protein
MTGSPGAAEAARYLAEALAEAGVEPAGDGGSYLQAVPVERRVYDAPPAITALLGGGDERELVHGVDFHAVTGELPEGELELCVARAPGDVPADPEPGCAWFADAGSREGEEWLAAAEPALALWAGSERPGPGPAGVPGASYTLAGGERSAPTLRLRGAGLELVRSGEVERLRIAPNRRIEVLEAHNVVGRIAGRARPEEAIVFTAHYDHIGTKEAPPGAGPEADLVFNGADDDASGCAAVIELAQALAVGPPPERTLLFLLVTGEELGLLGTRHYLAHPSVPLAATRANLNFEMLGRPDPIAGGAGRLWLTGDERTNLGAAWRELGLAIVPDPRPEQNFFVRSDNYAFAERGIVAQTLSSYDLHEDYHGVDDEAERLDYAHMETGVRAAYRAARALADGSLVPRWLPGKSPLGD